MNGDNEGRCRLSATCPFANRLVSRETHLGGPYVSRESLIPAPRHVSRESLSNAKLRKDHVQQVLDIHRADNPAKSVRRKTQLLRP